MVAFDGSAPSRRALQVGIEMASKLQQVLYTVTVTEGLPEFVVAGAYEPVDPDLVGKVAANCEDRRRSLIDEATCLAKDAGVELHAEGRSGPAVDSIIEAVRQHACDLLIIGLNHHAGLVARLAAHTGRDVTERAPCSVLGVR